MNGSAFEADGEGVGTVSFHICVRTQRYCESEQDRHECETKPRVWLIPTVSLRLLASDIFYMLFTLFERQKKEKTGGKI